MAYNYLVLHQEDDGVYGTDFSVRWFEDLQKNGVFVGSAGADDNAYYRLDFQDGAFTDEKLGEKIGSRCTVGGQSVTEADFSAWLAETMGGDVTWHVPEN